MKPENRPKIKFEGREYDDYQATQMQRRIERQIRTDTRLKKAYEAAGLEKNAQNSKIRLRQLNKKYREFSKAAGLPEQRERMKVLYVDDASKAKAAKRLEIAAKSCIMKTEKSFVIGRSLGAMAKNYDVVDRQTGIVYRFVEGTKVKDPKVFAGYKGVKPLAPEVIEGLVAEFGGSADKWQHAKGIGILNADGEEIKAEVHWFQEESVGKVKFKVKEWIYD